MQFSFIKAKTSDISPIWIILQQAIERRKAEGSQQWQDGYPNLEVIQNDIEKQVGFVLKKEETIVGYVALLVNDEPAYKKINGEWLNSKDFVVFHRVAISEMHLGRGLAKKMLECIDEFAISNNIYNIRADTNFDNLAMITIFEKVGYIYCGEVLFRGSARKAYQKILIEN